jgi:hypothetical protein
MTAPTPCYRHPRGVWMAACSDCTAWHMAAALARRDEVVRTSPRTDVPPAALRLVA